MTFASTSQTMGVTAPRLTRPRNWTLVDPSPQGDDDVREYLSNNGCFCAKVFKAKELELTIHSYVPNDLLGTHATQDGINAIKAHENRRITVIDNGFTAFLKPAELDGSATKKCGEICDRSEGKAEEKLRKYLADLRATAVEQCKTYNVHEQAGIGREVHIETGGLFDGFADVYQIAPAGTLSTPNCPGNSFR